MPDQHHNSDYVDAAPTNGKPWPSQVPEECLWLGDLAGFWLDAETTAGVTLNHQACGAWESLEWDYLAVYADEEPTNPGSFLANVVATALQHKCQPAEGEPK